MPTRKSQLSAADLPAAFQHYDTGGFHDEMLDSDRKVRPHYQHFLKHFGGVSRKEFEAKRSAVDLVLSPAGRDL